MRLLCDRGFCPKGACLLSAVLAMAGCTGSDINRTGSVSVRTPPIATTIVDPCAGAAMITGTSNGARSFDPIAYPQDIKTNCSMPATPDVENYILSEMKNYRLPGFAVVVVRGKNIVWRGTFGYADVQTKRLATMDTLWSIGSLTKLFTGTAMMQLVEQGKLSLDADSSSQLAFSLRNPNFPNVAITPRMLLSHVSSLPHNPPDEVLNGMINDGSYYTMPISQSLPLWLVPGQRLYRPANFNSSSPGTLYEYSNLALTVAGRIVETASGKPWENYLHDNVFAPLGMKDSYGRVAQYKGNQLAVPYANATAANQIQPYQDFVFAEYPSGELITSGSQMASFVSTFATGGVPLLKPATFSSMLQAQYPNSQVTGTKAQGLSWYMLSQDGADGVWGHSGAADGTSAMLGIRPQDGLGFFMVTNMDSDTGFTALLEIYPHLLQAFAGH